MIGQKVAWAFGMMMIAAVVCRAQTTVTEMIIDTPGTKPKVTESIIEAPGFESVKIAVKVVDKSGAPIAGAQLAVSQRMRATGGDVISVSSKMPTAEIERQTAGDDGAFIFTNLPTNVPVFYVSVRAAGYPVAKKEVVIEPPRKEYTVQFTLDKSAVITTRGTVVDEKGRPIEGVEVTASTDYPNRKTTTDKSGRFVLAGVAPEDNKVECNFYLKGYIPGNRSTSKDDALSGTWKVVMINEDATAVTGHAYFADGTAAAGKKIRLQLRSGSSEFWTRETSTDAQGAFRVVIWEPAKKYTATAFLQEDVKEYYMPHGCWKTPAGEVTPGQRDLKLVFENRGRIGVTLKSASPIPPGTAYRIECKMLNTNEGNGSVLISSVNTAPPQLTWNFDKLSPGTYTIEAKVVNAEHWSWQKTVELTAGDMQTSVTFELPKMEFGGLRARILEPDGKTPVARGQVWIDSPKSAGWHPIENGVVKVDHIPVGTAHLTTRIEETVASKAAATIKTGEVTDLGDIVLVSLEKGSGWIEGRVLYEDGTPALGATIYGGGFDAKPVEADGSFEKRLPLGKNNLIVGMEDLARWPRSHVESKQPSAAGFRPGLYRDSLVVPIEVKAGTTKCDVTIPLKNFGKVSVEWRGGPTKYFVCTIGVILKNGVLLTQGHEFGAAKHVGENIPAGKRVVLLSTENYRGCQEAAAASGDSAFVFDPAQAGSIAGRVVFPAGSAPKPLRIALGHPALIDIGKYRELDGGIYVSTPAGTIAAADVAADGRFRFEHVGPGRYALMLDGFNPQTTHGVEVRAGKETFVELPVQGSSK